MVPWQRDRGALDERIAAIVAVESTSGGSLAIRAYPVEAADRFVVDEATVAVSIWREGADIVRISLRHDASGSIFYLQGGAPLIDFARELGLRVEPRKS
jgi:hypothetical protein